MSTLNKWWPTIVAILGAAGTVLLPAAQNFVAGHPKVSIVLGAAYAILAHILQSPVAPAKTAM